MCKSPATHRGLSYCSANNITSSANSIVPGDILGLMDVRSNCFQSRRAMPAHGAPIGMSGCLVRVAAYLFEYLQVRRANRGSQQGIWGVCHFTQAIIM